MHMRGTSYAEEKTAMCKRSHLFFHRVVRAAVKIATVYIIIRKALDRR